MKTLSSDKKVTALAADAVLVCVALVLSYIEAVLPLDFIPLPGFRLGLANIAITIAAFRNSPAHAAVVSLARILLVFLLFGNPTSLVFSLCGSALVIIALFVLRKYTFGMSFIGISLICAALHNCGQLIAALFLVGRAVISYAPFLCLASLIFGTLNGIILNLIPDKIYNHKTERSL